MYSQGATNSHDLLYWEVKRTGRQIRDVAQMRDVQWHTHSCPIGWHMAGLHPKIGETSYEVTATEQLDKDVVVAGTSMGELQLSRFPSLEDAAHKTIRAHAASVSAICFVRGGGVRRGRDRLLSAGGDDLTMICWRVRTTQTLVDVDVSASRQAQRVEDIRRLSALLLCNETVDREGERGVDPWRDGGDGVPMLQVQGGLVSHKDVVPNWGSSRSRISLEDLELQLSRVHGYRGYDCRGNVLSCQNGLIVWFVGRLVVLSVDGATQRFYSGHDHHISCIAKCELSAEGGEEGGQEVVSAAVMASCDVGFSGDVHIWDTQGLTQRATLSHGFPVRLLSFGPAVSNIKILVSVGGQEDARIVTVWDWSEGVENQLARLSLTYNAPVLDLRVNEFQDPNVASAEQSWAASCGPYGVSFWHLVQDEDGRYNLSVEEGGVHHPVLETDNDRRDPMAICGQFLGPRVLVTGMANGDMLVWNGAKTSNRVRLAHTEGVFDLTANGSTLASGGKDCCVKLWDASVFSGSAVPQSRMIKCDHMLNDRRACVHAVALGAGRRAGMVYAGFASNDLLAISSQDSSDAARLMHGHTPRHDSRIEAREWLFSIYNAVEGVDNYLHNLHELVHGGDPRVTFLVYRHRRSDAAYIRSQVATPVAAGTSAGNEKSGGGILTWHGSSGASGSVPTHIQGLVQFDSAMSKEAVEKLMPHATIQRAVRDSWGSLAAHIAPLNQPGPGNPVQVGVLDERMGNDIGKVLARWRCVSLATHPDGTKGASVGRDGTVRVWEFPSKYTAGSGAVHQPTLALSLLADLYEELLCVAWSPDGSALSVGSSDGSVLLLNAHDLSRRDWQQGIGAERAKIRAITATNFRSDGQYVASVGFVMLKEGGSAEGRKFDVSVLISFVSKNPGHKLVALERGLLPAQQARGLPISVDWSIDGCYLQVSTEAREVLYWSVAPPEPCALSPHAREAWGAFKNTLEAVALKGPGLGWSSWRIPFGDWWDLALDRKSQAAVVAERCADGPLFATGDANGGVHLVSSGQGGAGGAELVGDVMHGGGVACLSFARDIQHRRMRLLTTGRDDLSVYEWTLKPCSQFDKRRKDQVYEHDPKHL